MNETWSRLVGQIVRVGNEDVLVNIREEYTAENPGIPARVRITCPKKGFITEGDHAIAWRQMLELLGIAPPQPPAIPEPAAVPQPTANPDPAQLETAESNPLPEPSPEPGTSLPETLPPVIAPSLALASDSAQENESPRHWLEEENEEEDYVEPQEERPMSSNILRDSLIKILNSPVEKEPEYNEEPPPEITAEHIAAIPYIETSADAAGLIQAVEEHIELAQMRADAAAKARRLTYLKRASRAKRCEHVKLNGETCGSPAVRREKFCHFHAAAHAPGIELPVIEDQRSFQIALTKLAQQVVSNKIDVDQAKLLLQIIDTAGRNLPAEGLDN